MVNKIPTRTLQYQQQYLSGRSPLTGRVEALVVQAKGERKRNIQAQEAYDAEVRRIEEENRRIEFENQRRLEEYNRQVAEAQKKQYDEAYRMGLRRGRRAKEREEKQTETFTQTYIEPPSEDYQGFTLIGEGDTLQNKKTGQVLGIYNLSGQEMAKRELLIKAGLAKPETSPTRFIIPDAGFPKDKPTALKDITPLPYLVPTEQQEMIKKQEEQIKISRKETAQILAPIEPRYQKLLRGYLGMQEPGERKQFGKRFYVGNIPNILGLGIAYPYEKVQRALFPKKYIKEQTAYVTAYKNSPLLRKAISNIDETSKYLFVSGLFAPYTKTGLEQIDESVAKGYIKPELKPKDKIGIGLKSEPIPGVTKLKLSRVIKLGKNKEIFIVSRKYVGSPKNVAKLTTGTGRTFVLSRQGKYTNVYNFDATPSISRATPVKTIPKIKGYNSIKVQVLSKLDLYRKTYLTNYGQVFQRIARKVKTKTRYEEVLGLVSKRPTQTKSFGKVTTVYGKYNPVRVRDELVSYSPNFKPIATRDMERFLIGRGEYDVKLLLLREAPKSSSKGFKNIISGTKTSTQKVVPTFSDTKQFLELSKQQDNIINKVLLSEAELPRQSKALSQTVSALSLKPQATKQREIEKYRTPSYQGILFKTDLRLKPSQSLLPKEEFYYKYRTEQRLITSQVQQPKLKERFFNPNPPKLKEGLRFEGVPVTPRGQPFYIIPPLPPLFGGGSGSKKTIKRKKRIFSKYSPSLTASVFKITSRKKPRQLTKGTYFFGFRPIIK